MPGDLLIITPSRGRPANIARLLQTTHALSRAVTRVHVAIDDDDPDLKGYRDAFQAHGGDYDLLEVGRRDGLIGWTNRIALERAHEFRCLASFGDDHVPRTPGFDAALVRAATEDGPAIAYPFDGVRDDIPEAPVVDSRIVLALGWLFEPSFFHYYGDTALADLGRRAGCLRYLRAIAVDHVHPSRGLAAGDATYAQSSEKIAPDKAAWITWRRERMAADVATVRALRESMLQSA